MEGDRQEEVKLIQGGTIVGTYRKAMVEIL
jgi:hypothetical protein